MLRTFWLADGLPQGEGEDPAKFLPKSVLAAMDQLGLIEPRLVCQTVNSLSRDANPERIVEFNTNVPALVFDQPAQMSCSGKVLPVRDGRAELEVSIQVSGPMINANLGGSLATPLGHYMVLGTANSVSGDAMAMQGVAGMGMGMGMDGGYGGYGTGYGGRGGYGGGYGRGEGGRGEYGRGGYGREADPRAAQEELERRMREEQQREASEESPQHGRGEGDSKGNPFAADAGPVQPKFNTSHFAFVVQVIEAESFAEEK
jgi:hypothetical protein